MLGVSPHTIKTYYGILADTFVCRELPPYSKSLRVQLRKSPKIYFTDAGLARFVAGERGLPSESTKAFGNLVEGFAVNEVLKQIEYHGLPWKVSYLQTVSHMEVDLIITNGSTKIAMEIKSGQKVYPTDYRPMLSLMAMDPDVQYGIVCSRQAGAFQLAEKIYHIPLWNL